MFKKIISFFMVLSVVFSLSSCGFSEEFEAEFGEQLKLAIEQELDEGFDELKKEFKKTVIKATPEEFQKFLLKRHVNRFFDSLKEVEVTDENRVEMLYIMEYILEICGKNGLSAEKMMLTGYFGLGKLMSSAKGIYDAINEIDGAVSDVSSLITGDYATFLADKAASKVMSKWEKQTNDIMNSAIEDAMHNIANNKNIKEAFKKQYLKENGF